MKQMTNSLILLAILLLSGCASFTSRYHRVAEGESLAQIAQRYDIPVEKLKDHNRDRLARGLYAGTKLYIPFEEGKDWEDEITSEIKKEPQRDVAAIDPNATSHFSWPVSGPISSKFGKRRRRMHEGIDIVANQGVFVRSARSGHVIYAGNRIPGYGNLVIIRHADTYSTVYAHLSKIDVKKGQFIARGQRLGRVGKTGRATAPHLHFEVRNDRMPVDPLLYLRGQFAANRIQAR